MLIKRKGQSTAEYAIVIGLVIAVAAGILQVALKGGIRQKNKQALDYMLSAGTSGEGSSEFTNATSSDVNLYSQDYRQTTVKGGDEYADESVMKKGGSEEKYQKQTTQTTAVSIETIDAGGTAAP
jgi:hypothetical protein